MINKPLGDKVQHQPTEGKPPKEIPRKIGKDKLQSSQQLNSKSPKSLSASAEVHTRHTVQESDEKIILDPVVLHQLPIMLDMFEQLLGSGFLKTNTVRQPLSPCGTRSRDSAAQVQREGLRGAAGGAKSK